MRHFALFLVFLAGLSFPLFSQGLRLVTWDLDGFDPVFSDSQPSESDLKRLRQVAANLKAVDPEIIVLQNLTDRTMARRLTSLLKPANYHLALHSTFRRDSSNSVAAGPSITVLSRRQPYAARSTDWRATGQIDLPGGFAFAGFTSGTNALCLYVAHLPADSGGSAGEAVNAASARKRELAGQYLVHHANWVRNALSNHVASFVVAGNYAVDPATARSEGAVRWLQQAGFKGAFPNLKRPALPDEMDEAASVLTGMLARNGEFVATPQVLPRKPFTHPMIAYDLVANAMRPAPPPAVPAGGGPIPARLVELDQGSIWLWVSGIAALSMTVLFAVWLVRRTAARPDTFRRRGGSSVVLDLSGFSGRGGGSFNEPEAESYSGSTGESAHAEAALWQARALEAEERAQQAVVAAKAGLLPQVGRLMRQRLFAWLTSQRSQLLTSHEVGTQQVLELEDRLEKIQGQFQDRLRTREERIAELEREVLAKEKTIRDLLRAQVRMANETLDR